MHLTPSLATVVLALPLSAGAATSHANLDRLGVDDPDFVVHADLTGDFTEMGDLFTEAYLAYLSGAPEIPPVPVNFTRFFEHLGLKGLTSVTWASQPLTTGGYASHALYTFEGSPQGLFLLTGDHNRPFTLREAAPADADLLIETSLNGVALYAIVRNLVIDLMGPMGQGLIDAQMNQPLLPDGPTLADLINRLTTQVQVALKMGPRPDGELPGTLALFTGDGAIRIGNTADLLVAFAPMLEQAGFVAADEGGSTAYRFQSNLPNLPLSVLLETLPGTNDLLVSFSEASREWLLSGQTGESTLAYRELTRELPREGVSFWYLSHKLSEIQYGSLGSFNTDPRLAPVLKVLENTFKDFAGDQAGVAVLEDDAYRILSHQPVSLKTGLAVSAALVPISLTSAILPTLQARAENNRGDPAEDLEEDAPSPPN